MIKLKVISSLEKVFIDDDFNKYPALSKISALRGERLSLELIYTYDKVNSPYMHGSARPHLNIEGELSEYTTVREVHCVPVTKPINNAGTDDNYLRTSPGLFPDLLLPLRYGGAIRIAPDYLNSAWVEISIPKDFAAGEHTLTFSVEDATFGTASASVTVEVIAAALPDEDIYVTQWFHCDGLANYYDCEVWSERHWRIVENFARTAARCGINLLLTPVFTPPLDTAVGGERLTTQLVGVKRERCGDSYSYEFDFTLLDRWIDMCDRVGIKYFEISHLFTQWGAAHAPKIMATEGGEYKRIFGWETEAVGKEYKEFLSAFLDKFLAHMKKRGDDKRCIFHISDEPSLDHLENYKAAKAIIKEKLEGYMIVDALSKIDFYKTGALDHPIPANNHIEPFLEENIKGLWTYYCVSQPIDVSNRYISMPLWRTRSLGMQMYKYNIEGFLHWGYNFYNNQFSVDEINPYVVTAADITFPAGDSFSVYPGQRGEALESIRIISFFDGLQDIKAMKLCESLYSHEEVVSAIEEVFGKTLTFATCAKSAEMMLAIRERINGMIKAKLS